MVRVKALSVKANRPRNREMWLDTAANDHFMWDRSVFKSYKKTANLNADLCEGTSPIAGEGTIIIPLGDMAVEVTAKHAPNFTDNLIAISKLVKKGFRVEIDSSEGFDGLTITHRYTGKTVLRSPVQNGLYPVLGPQGLLNSSAKKIDISMQRQASHWHEVVGHIGRTRLHRASNRSIGIPPLPLEVIKETQCVACLEGSTRRSPVLPSEEKTEFALDLTHTDIAGPIHPTTQANNKYVAVFLDDATKMSAVYLLKTRSLFADALQAYRALVENKQNRRIYRIRLDRAGENTSNAVFEMSLQHGIKLEYSPPYASQSNGAAERLIQELWKMARTMLLASKLPLSFWGEAISYANWLRNRLPSHSIGLEIPFEIWYGYKPNLSTVLRFGQPGYSFQYKPEAQRQKKLLPRSLFSHFVGMEGNQRLYRVFVPSKKGISFCRASDFTPLKDQSQLPTVTELLDGIARRREFEEQNDNPVAADEAEESLARAMFTLSSQIPFAGKAKGRRVDSRLPRNFEHACQNPRWAEAIDREYKALVERGTWRLIPFRQGMKPLPFTWQFKVKETPGAEVQSLYKARCCLRGDKQMPFRDFDPDGLYAPVARHETLRMLIAKSAPQDLILEGVDISNAYLYGDLDQPVVMQLPTDSSGVLEKPDHVALVVKSLYGHKRAANIWGTYLHETITKWGFKQSKVDQRMYLLRTPTTFAIMIIVVDDMAIATDKRSTMENIKTHLSQAFKVKLLGSLKSFIGWELVRTPSAIFLHQENYIVDFTSSLNLQHMNPQPTPLPVNADLSAAHEGDIQLNAQEHTRYRSIVGGIMYVAVCTRPDVAFAASVLARQVHSPTVRHLVLAKRVVRYLLGTKNLALVFPSGNSEPPTAYCDSDWAGCRDTRRSTMGFIATVNAAPVLWTSRRQSIVSLSSGEAEYIALSTCGRTVVWLRRLFQEMSEHILCIDEPQMPPTAVRSDNTTSISLAQSSQLTERNKHISIKFHHIRDLVAKGVLELAHISTIEQVADILTKALGLAQLWYLFGRIAAQCPRITRN